MSWAARTAPPVPSASGWITVSVPSGRPGGEVAVGRDDHGDPLGARLARGEHRPGDHRPAADRVQDLGQRRAHPRALARGHDQDGQAAAWRPPLTRGIVGGCRDQAGRPRIAAYAGRWQTASMLLLSGSRTKAP